MSLSSVIHWYAITFGGKKEKMDSYGIISLLPVLVILVIAVTTKKTLFAMTCGLTVGAVILAGANDDLSTAGSTTSTHP